MKVYNVTYQAIDQAVVKEVASRINGGGIVAIPTETVYGLAAAVDNPAARKRLDKIKQRPPRKPYTVHISDREVLKDFNCKIQKFLYPLIDAFWPGPLTLVLWSQHYGARIGLRMPDDAIALSIIAHCGRKVFLPSANIADMPPATDAAAVKAVFDGKIDALVDAGKTRLGVSSTVVDVTGDTPVIVREGALCAEKIYTIANVRHERF